MEILPHVLEQELEYMDSILFVPYLPK